MTTYTAPVAQQQVASTISTLVVPLQRDYLNDRSGAVGSLARLRRGAGKEFAQVPDLWGLADTGTLHQPVEGGRPLSEEELLRAEDAVHVALTLWALHQQSRRTGMHRPDRSDAPGGLGAAVRRLMPPGEIDEPVRKRFVRAGSAADLPALAQRLRDIVVLLRREDIPLDYSLLAEQLYQWQQPGGRDTVRRAWGRSFHTHRASPAGGADTSTTPDITDKDAS